MNFKPVLLWSDALILLLLAVVAAGVWLLRHNETFRAPLRQVLASRMGSATALILAVYVGIGLLDSLHYVERLPDEPGKAAQYSGEVKSVLDKLLTPLREHVEKTYSAPFATHLYAKETMTGPDGRELRDYPRLKHGGAHLADPDTEFWPDVLKRGGLGVLGGMVFWALLVFPLWKRGRAHSALAWTLLCVLVVTGLLVALAPHYHVLGTDKVGQDVLYLSLKSVRTGLLIGTLTTLVVLPLGLGLGIAAGYFGGRVDDVIQYLYTTLNSIPGVLLIAAAVLVVQVQIEAHPELFDTAAARADMRLLALCGILGLTGWTGLARLLRAETLKLRELEFVQAARAFGVSRMRILARHLLPNVMHLVLITVVIDFSGLVLAEAVLSYVGVGVDPAMISFGNMINGARLELAREPVVWWQLVAAFLFMFVLVLAANLFADQVRDALDPKAKGRA
ncbi:MAG: peptide/nickel transport system permease protein [bacterium]|nr:MAG: peptide/nickel transport system permease protein [bacterium]KAF0149715.1 MAG: peptide/nickel transport system permease protein [bacterium]KAF0169381.1 MAG: peptide/nickel transport system permease protein [bacterium]TXT21343.1 MAG: peptide/nickel transport system permease protein [bacterium]